MVNSSKKIPKIAHRGRFWGNVKWQLISVVSQTLLSAILLAITARQLGAVEYGVMSIVLGYVAVVNLLLEPRIQDVAGKEFSNLNQYDGLSVQQKQEIIDLFIVEGICKFLPCVSLILLAPILVKIGNLSSDSSLLIIVAATGAFLTKLGSGLSVGLLRVIGRLDLHTYCAVGDLFIRLLFTVALIKFSMLSVIAYLVVFSFTGILSNAILLMFVARQFEGIGASMKVWKPSEAIQRIQKKRNLIIVNIGLSASDLMNKDLDVTLMSPLISSEQIGNYKMAKNIAMLTLRAIDPFYSAMLPEISRLVAMRNFPGVRLLILKSSIGLLILSLFASFASYALIVLYGDVIIGTGFSTAHKLLPCMLIGVIVGSSFIWAHPLVVALNRADISLKGSLFGSIVGLATFFNLTTSYGALGSSIAWSLTMVSTFVFTALASYFLLRERERQISINYNKE